MLSAAVFWLFLTILRLSTLFQNEYTIRSDCVDIISYNREIVRNPKADLFQYNKTTKAFKGSLFLRRDIDYDSKVNLTVYKFINRKYRYYPVDFKRDPCGLLKMGAFGIKDVIRLFNITECPIPRGYYEMNNYIPDVSKFPRHLLPFGKYKICGRIHDRTSDIIDVCWKGDIIDPEEEQF